MTTLNDKVTQVSHELESAIDKVNGVAFAVVDHEYLGELHIRLNDPAVWAQVLMENMRDPMGTGNDFTIEEKAFWMQVASVIGTEWINKFRRIGAFMATVDKA